MSDALYPQGGTPVPPWIAPTVVDLCGSTNDVVKEQARAGAPEGVLVRALRQEAGRGRRGRAWQSPPGNLMFSLLLRPGCPLAQAAELSFVTAIAVGETISSCVDTAPKLKWPNDVLVDGAKIAGILLEAEALAGGGTDWVVAGVGINVRHHPDDVDYPATSLYALGADVDAAEVLSRFMAAFDRWYARWRTYGFAPVRAAWLNAAQGLGRKATVRLTGETFEGTLVDLSDDGALLIDVGGRTRRVTAGDVFFAPGGE